MLGRSSLEGKYALVTGGGSGIGMATSMELARRGAFVHVVDVDGARAERTARIVAERGGRARAFAADVSRESDVDALAAAAGPIDVLVNNAGVAVVAPFTRTKPADWEWVMGVNVWGPLRVTRAFLPSMLERRAGHVVVVASLAGLVGAPGMVAYSTTKFAAVGFAEALRHEVARAGVGVTLVCPGFVRTNLHRATRYDDDAFRRLLDDAPSFWGMSQESVARAIARGIERRRDLVVLGPEKIGWWLKRVAPGAAHALTSLVAKRVGIAQWPSAM